MSTQIVRPAGAGSETVWVLTSCALVVALAAAFVGVRTTHAPVATVAQHQIDARRDLTPAEQGLYADLRIADDEIQGETALPSVAELAEQGLAPFVVDMSQARRGDHVWQRLTRGAQVAYLGISRDPAVAGDLLLVEALPDDQTLASGEPGEPNVWLHRGEAVAPPDQLDTDSLAHAGWHQIVAQFDAGVTRERRNP